MLTKALIMGIHWTPCGGGGSTLLPCNGPVRSGEQGMLSVVTSLWHLKEGEMLVLRTSNNNRLPVDRSRCITGILPFRISGFRSIYTLAYTPRLHVLFTLTRLAQLAIAH